MVRRKLYSKFTLKNGWTWTIKYTIEIITLRISRKK